MTEQEITEAKRHVDTLSREEMAHLYRFSKPGHPFFLVDNGDLPEYFRKVFEEKGGWDSKLSKLIGWRAPQ